MPASAVLAKAPIWWHTKTMPNKNASFFAPNFRFIISLVGVTVASPVKPVSVAKSKTVAAFFGHRKTKNATKITRRAYKRESEFFNQTLEHKKPHNKSPAMVAIPKTV